MGVATTGAKAKAAFIGGKVSKVENDVRKNMVWVPDGGMKATIDPGKAKVVFLLLSVFEKDSGKFRAKLTKDIGAILSPPKFVWQDLEPPANPKDIGGWIRVGWKFISRLWRRIVEDEHLGTEEIAIDLGESGWAGTREIKFRGFGGDYPVALRLTAV